MVTKTEQCHFSEFKVYPGRGNRFVAKDGRTFFFINKKCTSLHFQKVKAGKLTWTTAWRRRNKKGRVERTVKRRTRRTTRKMKAIVGMSLAEINRIRGQDQKERQKLRTQVKEEQKKKRQKEIDSRKAAQRGQKKNQPKNFGKQPKGGKAKRTGY